MFDNHQRILVVAAHPDDEAFGCAGTIALHSLNNQHVKIVLVSDGETSRKTGDVAARKNMAKAAGQVFGVLDYEFLDFPDQKLDVQGQLKISQAIETIASKFKPNIVYTHYILT